MELLRSVSYGACTKCNHLIPLWDASRVNVVQQVTGSKDPIRVYACPEDGTLLAPVFVDSGCVIKVGAEINRPVKSEE